MIDIKKLDAKIQRGYLLILEKHVTEGCDEWLDAWEEIKELIIETGSKDIYELDEKYSWSGLPSELAEDIKNELHMMGIKNPVYQQKYNAFNEEKTSYIGNVAPLERNKRIPIKNGFSLVELSDLDLSNIVIKKEPAPFVKQIKTGRNEPCLCGSGKKYKKCCGAKIFV